jgi:hypothetical protein
MQRGRDHRVCWAAAGSGHAVQRALSMWPGHDATMLNDNTKTLVLLLTSGVLTVGGFSVAGAEWSDSSLTAWIEALATCAAFLAAVVAARYAAAVFAIEDARDQRRLDAELREQAEKVAAWLVVGTQTWGQTVATSTVELVVRNASDLPVYEFDVQLEVAMEVLGESQVHADHRIFPTVPPGSPAITEKRADAKLLLPETYTAASSEEKRQIMADSADETRVRVTFRDAGNRWWKRNADGTLEGPLAAAP